jgi:23S rRNA (adenine2030-N6)-methyltransferase
MRGVVAIRGRAAYGVAMSAERSRYAPEGATPDYSHRLHAGNVGDVWKHVVLVEVLQRLAASGARTAYVETHAGEGRYPLAATGEWTEGIGRLWTASHPALARYLELCRQHGRGDARPTNYPGSPLLARTILGPQASLALWERDAKAAERLASVLDDAHTRVTQADGLAALADALGAASSRAAAVAALVDPPWSRKGDWREIPEVFLDAARRAPRACLLLWYPVKSLTRPNAMLETFAAAGVAGAAAELVTTPLEHQRNRLNGSGVVLVHPPDGTLEAIAAAAPAVAACCATFPGTWSLRLRAFAPR